MAGRKSDKIKIQDGYGAINLEHPEEYKPWLHTRDVRSGSGKRHIIPDLVYPNRMIYLMSNLERDTYYYLRLNEKVQELFEQVPLELKETISICEELGIAHPRIPSTGEWSVMTTDFLVYFRKENSFEFQAFAVKPEKELDDQRVLEKLRVEQIYWTRKKIPWSIITEAVFR